MTNDSQTTNVSDMDSTSLVSAYFEAMRKVSDSGNRDYTEPERYFDEIAERCYKQRKNGVFWNDSYFTLDYTQKLLRIVMVL